MRGQAGQPSGLALDTAAPRPQHRLPLLDVTPRAAGCGASVRDDGEYQAFRTLFCLLGESNPMRHGLSRWFGDFGDVRACECGGGGWAVYIGYRGHHAAVNRPARTSGFARLCYTDI